MRFAAVFRKAGRVVGLAVLAVLKLLRPFVHVRIAHLPEDRIGHLVGNTYLFIDNARRSSPSPRQKVVVVTGAPCNAYLRDLMVKELRPHTPVLQGRLWSWLYFQVLDRLEGTDHHLRMVWEAYGYRRLNEATWRFSLPEADRHRGQAMLERLGIGPDDWFACIHTRDPAYLQQKYADRDSSYHDFRDCSIANYMSAAERIAAAGGWVLRLGKTVMDRLPEGRHPRIIDYAAEHQSDFLDIYLLSQCRFFLGCGSGPVVAAALFGRPYAAANMVPLDQPIWHRQAYYIPKLLRDSGSGAQLHYAEVKSRGLFGPNLDLHVTNYHEKVGAHYVENDADDVLDLCLDMLDRPDGRAPDPAAAEVQAYYRATYLDGLAEAAWVGDIGPRFALKNRHLIMPS